MGKGQKPTKTGSAKVNTEHKRIGIKYADPSLKSSHVSLRSLDQECYNFVFKKTPKQAASFLKDSGLLCSDKDLRNIECYRCGSSMHVKGRNFDVTLRCCDSRYDNKIRNARLLGTPLYTTSKRIDLVRFLFDSKKISSLIYTVNCFVILLFLW